MIDFKDSSVEMTVESLRDFGISLWEQGTAENDNEKQKNGLSCLIKAYKEGDLEATAIVGLFIYRGILKPSSDDPEDMAIRTLYYAATRGSLRARTYLNKICGERYYELINNKSEEKREAEGPLTDFDGKRFVIDYSGKLVPIDAKLEYKDGINLLTFSLNVMFADEEVPQPRLFEEAVISGIKEWEGEYSVFGGQKLHVTINVTTEDRLLDNVAVIAVTDMYKKLFSNTAVFLKNEMSVKHIDDLVNHDRSIAVTGLKKWSVKSKKIIYIAGDFNDSEEIKSVAKHEFGHALGLGDLYADAGNQFKGVDKGTYAELDGYYISNNNYNLVMSDHHGPVSNNDIEMVVLAFSENKIQLYQKNQHLNQEISKALGRGD